MKHLFKKSSPLLKLIVGMSFVFIVTGITVLTVTPGLKDKAIETRNTKREADVELILKAVHQYASHNEGSLPMEITGEPTEICASEADCQNLINLSELKQAHVVEDIPKDPKCTSEQGTGYFISRTENGRVTISAPQAEQGAIIQITR